MSEPYVRPDVRRFLDHANSVPGPSSHELSPAEARARFREGALAVDAPVGELAVIRDLAAQGPAGPIPLRLFDARAARDPGPAIIFYHGGSFVLGDLDTHASFCAQLARLADLPVVAVDYRLAPEHPFPAAPDDAIAAARWIAANGKAVGRELTGLAIMGESAGGNLAIVTALTLRDQPAAVPAVALWAIYPPADPVKTYPSAGVFGEGFLLSRDGLIHHSRCYAADHKDWRYAPMLKDLAGLPPTLVTTASLDPLRDQGRAFAAACVQAGVATIFQEARGMIHGFCNFRRAIPSAEAEIEENVVALSLLISGAIGR